jgi:hypothetical protein
MICSQDMSIELKNRELEEAVINLGKAQEAAISAEADDIERMNTCQVKVQVM